MRSPVTVGSAYVGVLVEGLRVTVFMDHIRFVCECQNIQHRDRVAAEAYTALDCWPPEGGIRDFDAVKSSPRLAS